MVILVCKFAKGFFWSSEPYINPRDLNLRALPLGEEATEKPTGGRYDHLSRPCGESYWRHPRTKETSQGSASAWRESQIYHSKHK